MRTPAPELCSRAAGRGRADGAVILARNTAQRDRSVSGRLAPESHDPTRRGEEPWPFNYPRFLADNLLEPHYSAKTISFHHGKHHKAYVDNANKLIAGTDRGEAETLVNHNQKGLGEIPAKTGLVQQCSPGIWNHSFLLAAA